MHNIFASILNGFKAFPPATRYILLGSIILAVAALAPRLLRKAKKLKEILSNKKYRQNPQAVFLSPDRQTALSIGAINAEQTMFYVNSLTTGIDPASLRDSLQDYYQIISPASAKKELDWLLNEGHRGYFDVLKQKFSSAAPQSTAADLPEGINAKRLPEYLSNIKEGIQPLIQGGYISQEEDLALLSIMAWDMGRLVVVARCCYDCSYITQKEAWEIIEHALALCKDHYANWKELAAGYVTGRCMWSGFTTFTVGIMGITHDLLTDPESPWQKLPLQ